MNISVIGLGARRSMARSGLRAEVGLSAFFPVFFAVLITLFAIVYFKDLNRRYFLQEQAAVQQMHLEKVKSGQYLLEQSALSSQSRVESIAQTKLGMILPSAHDVVMLQLS